MESNVLKLIDRPREDADFLDRFLRGRPDATRRVYAGEIRLFQEFLDRSLRHGSADDLRRYLDQCRGSGLKPGSVRHKVAVVKALYSFLSEEGLLEQDPMSRVTTPPHPSPHGRALSAQQIKVFFKAIPSYRTVGLRDRALFLLGASCGLRLGELSRLSCGDASDGPEKGWTILRIHGKGGKERYVQVRPEVWAEVQLYLRRRKDQLTSTAPLFCSLNRTHSIRPQRRDLRIARGTIYKRFKLYGIKAGLPPWAAPHALRHFFAASGLKSGANIEAIRRALGHSSLSVTQRYLGGLDQGINEAFKGVKLSV